MSDSLRLNLTGRMAVIIELEDYGPIQIRVDDQETVREVIRAMLGGDRGTTSVDSYTKRTEQRLRQVLEGSA